MARKRTPKPPVSEAEAHRIFNELFAEDPHRPTMQSARGKGFHGDDYWFQACLKKWPRYKDAPKRSRGGPSPVEGERMSDEEVKERAKAEFDRAMAEMRDKPVGLLKRREE